MCNSSSKKCAAEALQSRSQEERKRTFPMLRTLGRVASSFEIWVAIYRRRYLPEGVIIILLSINLMWYVTIGTHMDQICVFKTLNL